MALVLLIALIVVPIAELYVIVQVAQEIGVIVTLLLLVAVAVAGTWLLKQQGTAAWTRLRRTLQEGRMPTSEVSDGALIMLGGAFLLTPGFLTDIFGLILLLPPTRALVKRATRRAMGRWAEKNLGTAGQRRRPIVDEAKVVRVERNAERTDPATSSRRPPPSSALPSDAAASPEDGSPDKG